MIEMRKPLSHESQERSKDLAQWLYSYEKQIPRDVSSAFQFQDVQNGHESGHVQGSVHHCPIPPVLLKVEKPLNSGKTEVAH